MTYERMLQRVKQQFPDMDEDEQHDTARDWLADHAEELANREDTPSITDTMPDEVLRLRAELRGDA